MGAWWAELGAVQRVLAYLAIPGTAVLLIQTILLFIGLGGGGDSDSADGHDFEFDGNGVEVDGGIDIDGDGVADILFDDINADTVECSHNNSIGDGLSVFSVRGIVAFMSICGWVGIALIDLGLNVILSCVIAFQSGIVSMFLIALAFKYSKKLESTGNVNIRNAIGLPAQVYLRIPSNRQGQGKVNVTVQNRFREYSAVTDFDQEIKTGSHVVVTGIVDNGVLLVSPNNSI